MMSATESNLTSRYQEQLPYAAIMRMELHAECLPCEQDPFGKPKNSGLIFDMKIPKKSQSEPNLR